MIFPPKIRPRWKNQYRIVSPIQASNNYIGNIPVNEHEKRMGELLDARIKPKLGLYLSDFQSSDDGAENYGVSTLLNAFKANGLRSRFTDGYAGIYYATQKRNTAIYETVFHRQLKLIERELQEPQVLNMQLWIGKILMACYDIRGPKYLIYHDPDDYSTSCRYARQLLRADPEVAGIIYRSVRHPGGKGSCLAALRPDAISVPLCGPTFHYHWNGQRITHVSHSGKTIITFPSS